MTTEEIEKIERLMAENGRMREALKAVIDYYHDGPYSTKLEGVLATVAKALKPPMRKVRTVTLAQPVYLPEGGTLLCNQPVYGRNDEGARIFLGEQRLHWTYSDTEVADGPWHMQLRPGTAQEAEGSLTFGSLFAGYGGIDLGLEAAGMECRWQVEKDEDCCKVLAKHWPDVKRYGDITQLEGNQLERVDVLAGGFPCQDISQAGKQTGFHHEDGTLTRSGLWFEFARLIGELRPRYVLIENVSALLIYDNLRRVLGELSRLGYVGCWRCLRASEFGASHLRKRVFIVGVRADLADTVREGPSPFEDHEPHQRARPDDSASASGRQLAHGPSRGRRELRESPGRGGHLDGRGEVLADSANIERGSREQREQREQARYGRRGSDRDREALGDSPSPRSEGGGNDRADCGDACEGAPRSKSERASTALEDTPRHEQRGSLGESGRSGRRGIRATGEPVADAINGQFQEPQWGPQRRNGLGSAGAILSDAYGEGLPDSEQSELPGAQRHEEGRTATELCGPFAPGPNDPRWPAILRERPDLAPAIGVADAKRARGGRVRREADEEVKSEICRVSDGISDRMERAMTRRTKRLSRLGNAVVPQCAYYMAMGIMAHADQQNR